MRYRYLLLFIIPSFFFSSCKLLYPNYILRDTKDFKYFEIQEAEHLKQVILPEDRISFNLYTREGFNLIDVLGGGAQSGTRTTGASYLVKEDGYVELTLLGELYVKGLTRLELENLLEEKYSVWYNDPFIQLEVTNRRVYIFIGVGSASVFGLPSENTKILEVIAMIGGIGGGAKSNRIKIIRGNWDAPSIKRIDLSTIAGLKDADFIVQPNDIIVIDPKLRLGQDIVREINYLLTLITTFTTVYLLTLSIIKQ